MAVNPVFSRELKQLRPPMAKQPVPVPASDVKRALERKPQQEDVTDEKIDALRHKRAEIELGGGPERIAKQHAAGKLTARERVAGLVDRGSFQEIGLFARHRATY